ncbi:hypothetical protein L195_g045271, partial [Trifolium pratense]
VLTGCRVFEFEKSVLIVTLGKES